MGFRYDHKAIDEKWQTYWAENGTFQISNEIEELQKKPKAYILDMFPYPSGQGLHVGHPKGYTASDVIARLRRMQGFNVLHPMGWDAFGLPAERAAERENTHPAKITARNVATFGRQLKRVGLSYDWDREINSSAVDYYKWTQWIFLKLYERGLAYMEDVPVNWCPALGTVLANEEVKDGRYVETGDIVERRLMRQWMLKITAYADRLIDDLDGIDWPESLKTMQRNWIGRSEGAQITFPIQDTALNFQAFTTRPDTLFGATYCVLAPEHELVEQIVSDQQREQLLAYVETAKNKSELDRKASTEKTGIFTGAYAINPANGEPIPIWVADYVLVSYGTGAIMAVPAHDERDHEFARAFGLQIIPVVEPPAEVDFAAEAYVGTGVGMNSGFLNGLPTAEAKSKMIGWLEEQGYGARDIQYQLRDWLFSRQRYWGEPFPIIHLPDGTTMAVPESELPVELPETLKDEKVQDERPPLASAHDEWLMVTLPDGRVGIRETNTMPQWAGSCWYYLRFIDPHNDEEAWDRALEEYWMPVDLYIGGVEHAVLHLLYSRFWHKVLYDCGLVSINEPFQRLFNQGMIQANSYQDEAGKYYFPKDVVEKGSKVFAKESGQELSVQLEKMSKSKHNVFGLDDVIDEYGADALRLYELFIGPLSVSGPWLMNGIEGVSRFLRKVWRLVVDWDTGEVSGVIVERPAADAPELNRMLHQTIRQVTESIESIDKMNTAVSQLMKFINEASQADEIPLEIMQSFLRLLSPIAPHISEELWWRLGGTETISYEPWPVYDADLAAEDVIKIPVQINGRVRGFIEIAQGSPKDVVEELALGVQSVQNALGEKAVRRVIVVPDKIVNIVV